MTLNLGTPQILFLVWVALIMIYNTVNHGKQSPPYNGYGALMREIILIALLAWGGFFS